MRISDWSSDVCSSDLLRQAHRRSGWRSCPVPRAFSVCRSVRRSRTFNFLQNFSAVLAQAIRSEEHTSELQSLMRISYAVFCLKKKNKHHISYSFKTSTIYSTHVSLDRT